MPSTDFGTTGLIATTIERWIPTLVEQIFTSMPFMWALDKAGSIED